ncbi:LIM-domain-containing protein [Daedalea quercina L-15889]|uniref:Cysteine-rich protein 1 n=1 Tax=Daedalea quercina L-15889 TaxID=1314783 RepID=A0A165PED2_9APHY|nr:LIM-domain-containing protein [Daedalea quercina L-15889]
MHPFGGTPICPRCNKAVYAAEQIMGPGRRLYHKSCLTCTSCGKRLDSYNLLEHDQEPYCKNCHVRLFATRTLGLQNLPNRDEVPLSSPPISPTRTGFSPTSPTRNGFSPNRAASPPIRSSVAPPLPARRHATGGGSIGDRSAFPMSSPGPPVLRPTRALSPTRGAAYRSSLLDGVPDEEETLVEQADAEEQEAEQTSFVGSMATHTGRSQGGLPRTVPLSPAKNRFGGSISSPAANGSRVDAEDAFDVASPDSRTRPPDSGARLIGTVPLAPTSTGTRYGRALSGVAASPMVPMATGRQWGLGGSNPSCGKCGKTVYFAEQVKAIGKTYHKGCLRCTECNTHLDSTRLTERDGNPYCHRCYSKLYGPQGSGYALLGKAGG